ncbi:Uncharacterised protein [BD1-7 clade bacterium]|uniref:Bacterial surface antigen (D15) domain-containing protein n=1 Tax=BD1-7 clade bacterium TaxID=2029982 RepID=A0A5S9Q9I3_9GAMM|nr:Uncharacterised protein [BD1-7 clade bacterium]
MGMEDNGLFNGRRRGRRSAGVVLLLLAMVPSALLAADKTTKTTDSKDASPAAVTPKKADDGKTGWFDKILDSIGADDSFDPNKGVNFVFLPGPFFSPDAKFGLGLSSVGLYRLDPQDTQTQLSTLEINAFLTTNKSVGVSIDNKNFFLNDAYRVYIKADFSDAPEEFYGVGYEQGIDSSNKRTYTRQQIDLNVQALFRVVEDTYLGGGINFYHTRARRIRPSIPLPTIDGGFPENNQSSGVVATFVHDSRDVILNPYKGRLVEVSANYFNRGLGSDTDFTSYLLDYREYISLAPVPGLFAFQFKANFSAGEIPWNEMSTIGGNSGLRSYIRGRYRDRQTILSQLEYRVHIVGRHGMVTWIGGAMLADKVEDFTTDDVLPNIGVGYRLRLKDRVNLRLDLGFGRNGGGFYFNVNEAF